MVNKQFQLRDFYCEYLVRISTNNRSQIEIDLKKETDQMWKSIGKFQTKHLSVCSIQDFGMSIQR
jgi:hypothetical protein